MRELTYDEIPLIEPLGKAYLEASRLPIVYDGPKFIGVWQNIYRAGSGALCGHFHGTALVGVFGVHQLQSSFGDVKGANELIWWVVPEFRKAYDGLALLDWAEAWARARSLGLQLGAYDCLAGPILARLYTRRGYQRQGCIFTRFW